MKAVFADTFYWIAFTNVRDAAHEKAKALTRSWQQTTVVTSEEALIEYLNYFAAWGADFSAQSMDQCSQYAE